MKFPRIGIRIRSASGHFSEEVESLEHKREMNKFGISMKEDKPSEAEVTLKRLKDQVNKLECVIELTIAALIKLCEELDKINKQNKARAANGNRTPMN